MAQSKSRLTMLVLAGVFVGVFLAWAGVAQAENGANWKVGGANITTALLPGIDIEEVEKNHIVFASFVNGTFTEFLCKKAVMLGAKLELQGSITAGTKLKFSECVTKLKGNIFPACEPKSGGVAGTITTRELKGLIVLHVLAGGTKDTLIKLSPRTGTKFADVELGEECVLATTVPIFGSLTLKDCQNEMGVEKELHLVEEGQLSTLTSVDEKPEHAVLLSGSMLLELTGEHKGKKWAGVPF